MEHRLGNGYRKRGKIGKGTRSEDKVPHERMRRDMDERVTRGYINRVTWEWWEWPAKAGEGEGYRA